MSARDLLVNVLLGLVLLGGFWMLSEILTSMMGIAGYFLTMIIFMVIGYFLNDIIGRRLRGTPRASSIPNVTVYRASRRIYSRPSQPMEAPVSVTSPRICADCGTELEPSTRFCINCGREVSAPIQPAAPPPARTRTCGRCGATVNAKKRFCTSCGAQLTA